MRVARPVSMSSRRRAMSSLCTSSTDVTFYRTSKSSGVEACCGPEKWTGRWVTRRSSEIKVHPACWATAAYTASVPRKPCCRQRSGLVIQSHIQRHHGHVWQPAQGRGKGLCPERIIPGSTDGPRHLGQYQVWYNDGRGPRAQPLEDLPTRCMAGFHLGKPVDP